MTSRIFFLILVIVIYTLSGCTSPEKRMPSYLDQKYPGEEKIDSLLSMMSLEEKIAMIHAESSFASGGVERLNIPHWIMSDGPHGVRKEHGTDYEPDENVDDACTYLPVGVALGSTWNPRLAYEYGSVLGSEAKHRGKDVILGPGVNIIRTPLNGRNFEYLGEDPWHISRIAIDYIRGVQDQEISACVKHFIANNQELDRTSVSVEMSERTLHEIYLPAFKAAVEEADVNLLMGSYNKFRGQYCTHHEYLNTILKGEWKFKGVVVSDWGSTHDTKEAVLNGTDLEMGTDIFLQPNPDYNKFFLAEPAANLVRSGAADVKYIDDKVRRILRIRIKTKMFSSRTPGAINTPEHRSIALKVAEEAIVLLKNDHFLPLQKNKIKTLAVIGANATRKHAASGGSSQVSASYEITPLEGFTTLVGDKIKIVTSPGYEIAKNGKSNTSLINEAVALVKKADAVVYVGGWIHGYSDAWDDNAYDSETIDKPDMNLPFGQDELISAIQNANPNIAVVLYGGAVTDMTVWQEKSKAIIQAWYPGMEGGTALAKIIFGDINPSGKLPMTFPKKLEESPAHALGEYPGKDKVVHYNEGLLVGYRYFDTKKVEPLFPFGHGLSYTTFSFDSLQVDKSGNSIVVKVNVRNTGSLAGAEVIQLYVHDVKSTMERPEKELKAFSKVMLQPGEMKSVELILDERAFQYYDDKKRQWVLEPGAFNLLIGNSSKNIILTGEVIF
jgi:beta-glucosidase